MARKLRVQYPGAMDGGGIAPAAQERSGEAGMATRLWRETTVTLKWIRQRLAMGAWTHLNRRLYETTPGRGKETKLNIGTDPVLNKLGTDPVQNRDNCCAYAYDLPGRTLQPGELGGMSKYPDFKQGGYTCAELAKRIKADFPNNPNVGPPKDGKCPAGTHKVKPWKQPDGKEYHMQRQDDDGKWSDMPWGSGPKRCNPSKPDRRGDEPCDEICVPDAARY